jgi:putative transposase
VHRHRWAQAPAAPGRGEQGERSLLDRVVPQHARRGLRLPTTATSDGAPGLIRAIEVCFPTTVRIRCWFHRLANIRAKLPDEAAGEVLAHLYAVRDAPTLDAARAAADRFTNTYARDYPAAVACFTDDLDALLNIHRVPVRHRIRVRTTNLCERSFVEERRRTKVVPASPTRRPR